MQHNDSSVRWDAYLTGAPPYKSPNCDYVTTYGTAVHLTQMHNAQLLMLNTLRNAQMSTLSKILWRGKGTIEITYPQYSVPRKRLPPAVYVVH